ncbi:MAG TPA: aldose epimerase family protein [Pyrinomonadaceae bacterium]|jgi:aldose 1-epimerase|nr:aldose epimerase family protein [Pyrinomonadaceae bacterium]
MKITSEQFGVMPDGARVQLFTLSNDQGMIVRIINYGGIITQLHVPDRNGDMADVVLGHETLEGYLDRSRYFGALIGRYANRIAHGRFDLDGVEYQLAINNGHNHLHGGFRGFDKVVWQTNKTEDGLQLTYFSKDGEENYPGNLEAKVTYSLTETNELRIEYRAATDRATIVNLTNHSYFNLAGSGTILGHELTIDADAFTPVDDRLIPTGEIKAVAGTPMDFTSARPIGSRINDCFDQLQMAGGGYDHNFVLRTASGTLRHIATAREPASGRVLRIATTEPGVQFYSGNFLDGSIVGKYGIAYRKHSGFCLETQHFPDSPNHPNFPTTVLRPGEEYRHTTILKFSAE